MTTFPLKLEPWKWSLLCMAIRYHIWGQHIQFVPPEYKNIGVRRQISWFFNFWKNTGGSCPSGPPEASDNDPKWFPIPTNLWFKKNRVSSFHRSSVTSQSSPWPPTAHTGVLALQVHLRPLAMVPNYSSYQKTWGLKKNQVSSLHRSWVTSRRSPWPPTAHTMIVVWS